jgi:hypothetical protein
MWSTPTKERLDKIPRLYEQEKTPLKDQIVHLHFFMFGSDWWITEYDGEDTFFGFVRINQDDVNSEWGYISFNELKEISINGIEVDCEHEEFFPPQPVSGISAIKTFDKVI